MHYLPKYLLLTFNLRNANDNRMHAVSYDVSGDNIKPFIKTIAPGGLHVE